MTTTTTTPARTAWYGTCDACLTTVVVAAHPDRQSDVPHVDRWTGGFPRWCPVCDGELALEGASVRADVLR